MSYTVTPTAIPDLLILEPKVFGDARGFFLESWNQATFAQAGLTMDFVQDNHSRSARGVLRGITLGRGALYAQVSEGFTTRVLARFQNTPVEPWVDLLTALGIRAVLTSAVFFFISAALVAWQMDFISFAPSWVDAPLSPKLLLP